MADKQIKDIPLVSEVSENIKIPASTGGTKAAAVSIGQIKQFIDENLQSQINIKTSIPIGIKGKYINKNGTTADSANYNISKPFHLAAGEVLTYAVNATGVSYLSEVTAEGYKSITYGNASTSEEKSYTAEGDIDVVICFSTYEEAYMYISLSEDVKNVKKSLIIGDVLSESFCLSSITEKDADGNIKSAKIVFSDGTAGTINIVRDDDGNAIEVNGTYNTLGFVYTIKRDTDGDVASTNFKFN